jgi:hypothetical protein
MIIGGPSKSFKTWTQLDLALSVATGSAFWDLETRQTRVLFCNLEIQTPFFWRRVDAICRAKDIGRPADLEAWNLRGFSAPAEILIPKIITRMEQKEYGLIILDPVYKILGDRDENKAGDIADLLNRLETLAVQTGAAVVFGAHFAKGNASQKEAIDRVSGSGSFARDPDSIVMMTAHEEEGAFTVETILRNLQPMESFVVRRDHPLMVRDEELDPAKLKQQAGGRVRRTVEEILDLLPEEGATSTQWRDLADTEAGIGKTCFYKLVKQAGNRIYKSEVDNRYYMSK